MIGRILIKEWRDNIFLFVLGVANLLVAFGLFLARDNRAGLYGAGMFLLFFLPLITLLIGSSAFQSELKNASWTYIFSRPIAKPLFWAAKFGSQLSIIVVLLALFFLFKAAVPSSSRFIADLNFPTDFFHSSSALFIIPPLLAFTIAFSISFLSDKPFIVFFLSLLIVSGLAFAIPRFGDLLWMAYSRRPSTSLFLGLIFASFILASVIVFSKSDLSQRARAAVRFAALVVAFLAISFILQWVLASRGNLFKTREDYVWSVSAPHDGLVLFETSKRGLMEYDSASDETRPISRTAETYDSPVSFAAGRAAFVEATAISKGEYAQDIRIISLKDHRDIGKISLYGPDSPLKGQWLVSNCLLSPDGTRVSFVAAPKAGTPLVRAPVLYVIKTDGTRITPIPLPLPPVSKLKVLGWMSTEDSYILLVSDRFHSEREHLVKFNLETKTLQQTEAARAVSFLGLSPASDYALYELKGESQPASSELVLLDLKTFQTRGLMSGSWLNVQQPAWTSDGGCLGFCSKQEVYRYVLPDGPLTKVPQTRDPRYAYFCAFAWIEPGRQMAVFDFGRSRDRNDWTVKDRTLKVYDPDNRVVRILPVRDLTVWNSTWSAGNKLLVRDWNSGLWRLDLKTDEWKKVY